MVDPHTIGITVNLNAGSITPQIISRLKRFQEDNSGRVQLYLSRDLDEAQEHFETIKERGHHILTAAGGDGSLASKINAFQSQMQNRSESPYFALTKLGTGNAVAKVVGATRSFEEQLGRVLLEKNLRKIPYIDIPLLGVEMLGEESPSFSDPQYFTFAGAGWDGLVLNDYQDLGQKYSATWQRPFTHGLLGYFVSGFGKTLPTELAKNSFRSASLYVPKDTLAYKVNQGETEIINTNEFSETQTGTIDLLETIDGPVQAVFAGTTPYFGYGVKAFPRAIHAWHYQGGPLFEVRVIVGKPSKILPTFIPKALASWSIPDHYAVHSFLVPELEVHYFGSVEAAESHIGGDGCGRQRALRFSTINTPILRAIDYRKLQ